MNYPDIQAALRESSLGDVVKALQEMRERIEIFHTSEFSNYLHNIFPCLRDILTRTTPQFQESDENKCRHTVLDVFSRFPTSDILKPYVSELLKLCLKVASEDNEDNSLVSLRIIFELHKAYRNHDDQVQPFIKLVNTIYNNVPNATKSIFNSSFQALSQQSMLQPQGQNQMAHVLGYQPSMARSGPGPGEISSSSGTSQQNSLAQMHLQAQQQQHQSSLLQPLIQQPNLPPGGNGRPGRISSAMPFQNPPSNNFHWNQDSGASSLPLSAPGTHAVPLSDSAPQFRSISGLNQLPNHPPVPTTTRGPVILLYAKYIKQCVPQLVPVMMEFLGQTPPSFAARWQRERYKEFVAAQVKTLSFLTYLLRGFTELMASYEEAITRNVLMLLVVCPGEAVTTRKELLVSFRHILATDFRKGFQEHIDRFLDEPLLLGPGRAARESLKPLAHSALADLVAHARDCLSVNQATRVVYIFSKNVHDPELPLSLQTTSVRLLLNLVERLKAHLQEKDVDSNRARHLLMIIMRCIVSKFSTLRLLLPQVEEAEELLWAEALMVEAGAGNALVKVVEALRNENKSFESNEKDGERLDKCQGFDSTWGKATSPASSVLTKSLTSCLFRNARPPMADLLKDLSGGNTGGACLSESEVQLLSSYFKWGMEVLRLLLSSQTIDAQSGKQTSSVTDASAAASSNGLKGPPPMATDAEAKDLIENFACAFTVTEPDLLRVVVAPHLSTMVSLAALHPLFLNIPLYLLANSLASPVMVDILLTHLMTRMEDLCHPISNMQNNSASASFMYKQEEVNPGKPKSHTNISATAQSRGQRSSTLLRIFKMIFNSVSSFSENEKVLRPRLQSLVLMCLRLAHESRVSVNFCFVLRTLFRAIASGKFDNAYREMTPLLPSILSGLCRLLQRTEHPTVQNILLELCLTLPARLSSLLPHLPVLLSVLVRALRARGELPNLALRTLEFWVENLQLDFLSWQDPSLHRDIMTSVCSHLRPAPYPYGMLALRVLGKLGGRNRRFLRDSFSHGNTVHSSNSDEKMSFHFKRLVSNSSQPDDGDPQGQSVLLSIDVIVNGTCDLLDRLTTPAPVEAEVATLLAAYPEMHDGHFLPEQIEVVPPSLSTDSDASIDVGSLCNAMMNAREELTTKMNSQNGQLLASSEAFLHTGEEWSEAEPVDEAGLNPGCSAMLIKKLIEKEVQHISGSTFLEQKRNSLQLIMIVLSHLLHIGEGYSSVGFVVPIHSSSPKNVAASDSDSVHGIRSVDLHRLQRMITCVTMASADPLLEDQAKEYLRGLCTFFAATNRFCEVIDGTSREEQQSYREAVGCYVMNEVVLLTSADSRPTVYRAGGCWLLGEWLCAVDQIRHVSGTHEVAGQSVLLAPPRRREDRNKPALSVLDRDGVLFDMVTRAASACQGLTWRERVAGVRVIHELCLLLPRDWCSTDEAVLIEALLTALKHNKSELMVSATEDIFTCLRRVLISCHQIDSRDGDGACQSNDTSQNQSTSDKSISLESLSSPTQGRKPKPPCNTVLQTLILALFHPHGVVRLAAKASLRMISMLSGFALVELLQPLSPFIADVAKIRLQTILPSPEGIGVVAGLTHCISIRNVTSSNDDENVSLMNVDEGILQLLSRLLDVSETIALPADPMRGVRSLVQDPSGVEQGQGLNEDFVLSVSCFPADIPAPVELRLHSIRFIQALNLHYSGVLLSDECDVLRHRCYSLLFKSLSVQWEEVIVEAQRALSAIVNRFRNSPNGKIPKDVMTESLKPMLNTLQDRKRLTVPILQGLQVMLRLVTSRPFFHLGDKFLEHLHYWMDPETIMTMGVWSAGDELRVASSMMNLFHLLPRMSNGVNENDASTTTLPPTRLTDFLPKIITTCIRLETVRHRFRHQHSPESPYVGPLARFFSRHASEAVAHMLDPKQLSRPEIGHLLLRLVRQWSCSSSSQNTFMERLASSEPPVGGMHILLSSVFEPTMGNSQDLPMYSCFLQEMRIGPADVSDKIALDPSAPAIQTIGNQISPSIETIAKLHPLQVLPSSGPSSLPGSESGSIDINSLLKIASDPKPQGSVSHESTSAIETPEILDEASGHTLGQNCAGEISSAEGSLGVGNGHLSGDAATNESSGPVGKDAANPVTMTVSSDPFAEKVLQFPYKQQQSFPTALPASSCSMAELQQATLNGLRLLRGLLECATESSRAVHRAMFLHEHPRLLLTLRLLWNKVLLRRELSYKADDDGDTVIAHSGVSPTLRDPDNLLSSYDNDEEARILCLCLLCHCRHHPEDAEVLLELLPILYSSCTVDFTFLVDFCRSEVPRLYSISQKRNLLKVFFGMLLSCNMNSGVQDSGKALAVSEMTVKGLEVLVTPMLLQCFQLESTWSASDVDEKSKQSVLDSELIKLIMKGALGGSSTSSQSGSAGHSQGGLGEDIPSGPVPSLSYQASLSSHDTRSQLQPGHTLSDALRVELLKLATLLIEHISLRLVDHRKDLIRFAWNQIKAEDAATKHWAYVNVCRFISVYDTPPKIILQVFVALLRAYQPECKELVRLALDSLVPALPVRLRHDDFIKALKWAKKIMIEEGHVVAQMAHIWGMLARHAELFYSYRSHFVPQMINSLTRLGLSSTCTLEVRQTAIGVADAILGWELLRQQRKSLRGGAGKVRTKESTTAYRLLGEVVSMKREREEVESGGDIAEPYRKTIKTESAVVGAIDSATSNNMQGSPLPPQTGNTGMLPFAVPGSTNVVASSVAEKEDEFGLNSPMVHILANFLVRLGLLAADSPDTAVRKLLVRCFTLFRRLTGLHPVVRMVKLMPHLERLLQQSIVPSSTDKSQGRGEDRPRDRENVGSTSQSALATLSNRVLAALTTFMTALFNHSVDVEFSQSQPHTNSAFYSNLGMIQELLQPMLSSSSLRVQRLARILICEVMIVFPPEKVLPLMQLDDAARSLYPRLKELIEKALRGTAVDDETDHSSREATAAPSSAVSEKPSVWTAIQLLDEICIRNAAWVKNHGSALVLVAKKLLNEHRQATSSGRSSVQNSSIIVAASLKEHGQEVDASQVLATPHIALLDDAIHGEVSSLPVLLEDAAALATVLHILCRGLQQNHLSELRPAIVNLLGSTLESAESPIVIAVSLDYCCHWTRVDNEASDTTTAVESRRCPITYRDQLYLLGKIGSLDRLSEAIAQPLIARMAVLGGRLESIRSHENFNSQVTETAAQDGTPAEVRGLEEVGILCVKEDVRSACFARLMSTWRKSSASSDDISQINVVRDFTCMLESELGVLTSRNWGLLLLPGILLGDVDLQVPPNVACDNNGRLQPYRMQNSLDKFDFATDHPYAKLIESLEVLRMDVQGLTSHIIRLCLASADVGEVILHTLLSQLWRSSTSSRREAMTIALARNIARHCHRQVICWPHNSPMNSGRMKHLASSHSLNMPQVLLSTFLQFDPKPNFSVEFLAAAAGAYSAWPDIVESLEMIALTGKQSSGMGVEVKEAVEALLYLLSEAQDHDSIFALTRICGPKPVTLAALALEQCGMLIAAQKVLVQTVRQHNSDSTRPDSKPVANTIELDIWEQRWVHTAKHLSQWPVLAEYSSNLQLTDLGAEVAAIRSDWDSLRRLRTTPSVVAQLSRGSPTHKLLEVMLAVADGKLPEADRLCAQAAQMALLQWQLLPPLSGGSCPHKELFHLFHRVIELRESAGIMGETAKALRERTLPDLKGMLATWRDRLPEPCDGLHTWDSLLQWRIHVFQSIQSSFVSSGSGAADVSQLAALNDSPWTVISLARAARKHGLHDVSLAALSRLHSVSRMDVIDAFHKLREQILACLASTSELRGGLNIINSTNLEYFSAEQRAELFRLKGLFQHRLGLLRDAQQSYSQGVQVCSTHAKGWLSWGDLCFKLYSEDGAKEDRTALAVSTIVCILRSADCGSSQGRQLLSRVLWMVANEDKDQQKLSVALATYGCNIPEWLWLQFIPQLVEGLGRREGRHVKHLLHRVAMRYPLSLLSRLDANPVGAIQNQDIRENELNSTQLQVEIIEAIRTRFPVLSGRVMSVNDELRLLLAPSPAERLLTFLHRLYLDLIDDLTLRLCEAVPSTYVSGLIEMVGRTIEEWKNSSQSDPISDNPDITALCDAVSRDFLGSLPQLNLDQTFELLQTWIERLSVYVLETKNAQSVRGLLSSRIRASSNRRLMEEAFTGRGCCQLMLQSTDTQFPSIIGVSGDEDSTIPEIPGMYSGHRLREPRTDQHPRLLRILPRVQLVSQNGTYSKQISILGSDGRCYSFTAWWPLSNATQWRIEESFSAICGVTDWALLQTFETRRRDLFLQQRYPIPIAPGLQLLENGNESRPAVSLQEIYSESTSSAGRGGEHSVLQILLRARRIVEESFQNASTSDEQSAAAVTISEGLQYAFLDCCKAVPVDFLRKSFLHSTTSRAHERAVRRNFASQYGVYLALQLLLDSSASLVPQCFYIRPSEGSVFLRSVTSSIAESQDMNLGVAKVDVSLRITRCIHEAMGELFLLGPCAAAIGSTLDSLLIHDDIVESTLALYYLDSCTLREPELAEVAVRKAKACAAAAITQAQSKSPKKQTLFMSQSGTEDVACDAAIQELLRDSVDPTKITHHKSISWMSWL